LKIWKDKEFFLTLQTVNFVDAEKNLKTNALPS